jgi:tetratricopeptide (TPR) repeat protein
MMRLRRDLVDAAGAPAADLRRRKSYKTLLHNALLPCLAAAALLTAGTATAAKAPPAPKAPKAEKAPATTKAPPARPTYTMDNDPVRLGNRQLEKLAWADARARFDEAIAAGYHVDEAAYGLGVCDLREGRYKDAEAHFGEALAVRGGAWADARAELGLLLLRRGQTEPAANAFDEAAAADGKCWAANYGNALLLLDKGEWEKARDLAAAAKEPKGVLRGEDRWHHVRALVFLANGAVAQAAVEALQAQTLDPVDPRYTELVARVYEQQGNDELAVAAWEELLAVPGAEVPAATLDQVGRLYAKVGRPNEAREMYERAAQADSTYTPVLKNLAELYRRAKRPQNAARTWLRYVQVAPGDLDGQLGLAGAMQELGRFDEAAAAAKAALGLSPDLPAARLLLAQTGLRARDQGVRDEAGALAETMLAAPAPVPAGWTLDDQLTLADWQGSRKREGDALVSLARAAAMDSTAASVPYQQGLLQLRAGHTQEAAAAFQRALVLDPQWAGAQLNLGIARYQGGDPRAAIPEFRRATVLNPESTQARLLLGQALAAVDSLPAAEREYRAVLEREPQNAKALRGVGFCRLRAADYAGAARAYEQSTGSEPGNADGWAGLGSAQLGLGRLDAAGAAFAKARAIDPQNNMLKTGSELLNQARNAGKEASSR